MESGSVKRVASLINTTVRNRVELSFACEAKITYKVALTLPPQVGGDVWRVQQPLVHDLNAQGLWNHRWRVPP